jgi:choline dehydrogenase-like flavoprotein
VIDAVVVGSGASAVHAALALVESGRQVLLVDVANRDEHYGPLIPREPFLGQRLTREDQHRWFLGDQFEGVPFGPVRVGAQLTPPRQFLTRASESLAPTIAPGFQAMQSFALGGLAAGWGASTMAFNQAELRGWPITRDDLQPHYDAVAGRIGVCGPREDDLTDSVGRVAATLPPAPVDSNGEAFLVRYRRYRREMHREGLTAGRPRLALCTRRHRGRGPLALHDMEFWSDADGAVWRPAVTLGELRRHANFHERLGARVLSFDEAEGVVRVTIENTATGATEVVEARALVLAAGAFGTARIVARGLGTHHESLPLVSNPYTYFPCLHWARLGRPTRDRRHSLTQVTMLYDPEGTGAPPVQPQLYSYRSLLLFKLLKESPLGVAASIPLLQAMQDYFVIVGVFHEDRPAAGKHVIVRRGDRPEHDWLEVSWEQSADELRRQRLLESRLAVLLRWLGCQVLRRIDPGPGSSIHYAGTLPMTERGGPLTCTPEGRLRGAGRVWVADGSAFPHLPAKGLTFTLMANARRTGLEVHRSLREEAS